MWSHSVPSRAISTVPATTCQGVGKITLSLSTTTIHHTATSSAVSTSGGTACLSLSSKGFIDLGPAGGPGGGRNAQPHALPPARSGCDEHGELPVHVRRAGEVVAGRNPERQTEIL